MNCNILLHSYSGDEAYLTYVENLERTQIYCASQHNQNIWGNILATLTVVSHEASLTLGRCFAVARSVPHRDTSNRILLDIFLSIRVVSQEAFATCGTLLRSNTPVPHSDLQTTTIYNIKTRRHNSYSYCSFYYAFKQQCLASHATTSTTDTMHIDMSIILFMIILCL